MKLNGIEGTKRRARPPMAATHAVLLAALVAIVGTGLRPAILSAVDHQPNVDGEPIPVHLAGIRMIGPEQALLILADEAERRAVPIAVGRDQGLAIYLGQEKTPTPRPMTHDLMVRILDSLDSNVEKVIITELRDNTYYAEITIRQGRKRHQIDSRPSDAIALAVRLEAPIFASPDLLTSIEEDEPPGLTAEVGRRLGLTIQALEADLAEYMGAAGVPGVLVASVVADSPAGRAGLRRGDILQRLDGRSTADLENYRDALAKASRYPSFDVWRDGEQLTLVRP